MYRYEYNIMFFFVCEPWSIEFEFESVFDGLGELYIGPSLFNQIQQDNIINQDYIQ